MLCSFHIGAADFTACRFYKYFSLTTANLEKIIIFVKYFKIMKKAFLFTLFLLAATGIAGAQKIHKVNSAYQADIKVYSVDHEYQADLVVYVTDKSYNSKLKDNKGVWYFTPRSYEADKKVYFTDHAYQADLKIYFTDQEYRAGWKHNDKKHLLY